jgi:antitoxin MazE
MWLHCTHPPPPEAAVKTRLVRIGNSRGFRLPKPLILQAGLTDEVELQVREGAIVIASAGRPRAGWAEAAKLGHERGDDRPLVGGSSTRFDEKEWEWR